MAWFPAPALVKLNQEIQARWPGRETASDGVVGDTRHEAQRSDHNPCWTCSGASYGIVRATDRDVGGWPAIAVRDYILARCRAGTEKRIAYIISNGRIASVTYGWDWRPYYGSNRHEAHTHYSLRHDASNFDARPWLAGFDLPPVEPPPDRPPPIALIEDDEMARQFAVVDDPSRATYSVNWRTIQHVPDPAWQGVLIRLGLIDGSVASQVINMVQLEWAMKSVLESGGTVACARHCGACLIDTRYRLWAEASNDRAAIAVLTAALVPPGPDDVEEDTAE